jgi:hypothetical protein
VSGHLHGPFNNFVHLVEAGLYSQKPPKLQAIRLATIEVLSLQKEKPPLWGGICGYHIMTDLIAAQNFLLGPMYQAPLDLPNGLLGRFGRWQFVVTGQKEKRSLSAGKVTL